MTFAQLVFHLFNFISPALAMAALMPMAGRWVVGAGGVVWPRRCLWHALVGTLVLVLGLVLQEQDGQMATYAALVGVAALLEWALHRLGHRSRA